MITRENYEIWMIDYAEGKLSPAQQQQFLAFLDRHPDLKKELEAFDNISFLTGTSEKSPAFNLHKKQSWLLEKYSTDELVFHFNEGLLNPEELREWNELVKTMPALLQQASREKQLELKPRSTETFDEKELIKRPAGVYQVTTANCHTAFIRYYETRELALHTAIKAFLAQNPGLQQEFEDYGRLTLKPDLSVTYPHKQQLKKREKLVALFTWQRFAGVAVAASVILAVFFFYRPGTDKPVFTAQGSPDSLTKQHQDKNPQVVPQKQIPQPGIAAQNDPQQGTVMPANNAGQQNKRPPVYNTKQPGSLAAGSEKNNREKEGTPANKTNPGPSENMAHQNNPGNTPPHETPGPNTRDSVKPLAPRPLEQDRNEVAVNGNDTKNSHIQTVNTPTELVSAVFNKKYYEKETPQSQTGNAFYAMRNVVHTVSGGEADVQKQENKDYKSFSLKIGNFGFSRKKHKEGE